jgi:hypothetical protein
MKRGIPPGFEVWMGFILLSFLVSGLVEVWVVIRIQRCAAVRLSQSAKWQEPRSDFPAGTKLPFSRVVPK